MSQFAVLHLTKFKKLDGIGKHIDRTYFKPNVIKEKSCFNEELNSSGENLGKVLGGIKADMEITSRLESNYVNERSVNELKDDVENRIKSGYKKEKKIRSDAVKAVGVILSGSHERMKEICLLYTSDAADD